MSCLLCQLDSLLFFGGLVDGQDQFDGLAAFDAGDFKVAAGFQGFEERLEVFFMAQIGDRRGIRGYCQAIRSFCRFLRARDLLGSDPLLKYPPPPPAVPAYLVPIRESGYP